MLDAAHHTLIPARHLAGLSLGEDGRLPKDRTALGKWLARHDVPIIERSAKGGQTHFVEPSSLPFEVQSALAARSAGADPGQHDSEAWREFASASLEARERAESRATVARVAVPLRADGLSWAKVHAAVVAKLGAGIASESRVRDICKRCDGIAPANWAPALLDEYKGGGAAVAMSEEAWQLFLSDLRHNPPSRPRTEAWRRVAEVAEANGWHWPSFPTVNRRWNDLPEFDRKCIRLGRDGAERLYKHALRHTSHLLPLDEVSMDGRRVDVWVRHPSGRIIRPHAVALSDVASRKVIGLRFSETENAEDTALMILATCDRWGLFDRLRTDNSMAFAGGRVSGGAKHRFRGKTKAPEDETPGIVQMLGAGIGFALPANGAAKPVERSFKDMSRDIDTSFGRAFAGHKPGDVPGRDIVPVEWDEFLRRYEDGIRRHNAKAGRRCAGFPKNASFESVFDEGMRRRADQGRCRVLTADQRRLAGLRYKVATVDRVGRVRAFGQVYGLPDTVCALQDYIGSKVWIAADPLDYRAPVMVFEAGSGRLIHGDVPCVEAGAYDSAEAARKAGQARAQLRAAERRIDEAHNLMTEAELQRAYDGAMLPPGPVVPSASNVTRLVPQPVSTRPAEGAPGPLSDAEIAEFRRRLDENVQAKKDADWA